MRGKRALSAALIAIIIVFASIFIIYRENSCLSNKNNGIVITVNARHFCELKPYLYSSDIIGASIARENASLPPSLSDFNAAIGVLSVTCGNDQKTDNAIRKSIVFSALEDINNYIDLIPKDIDFIGYDMEGDITLGAELSNPSESIAEFSHLVHSVNASFVFSTTASILYAFNRSGILESILKNIDVIVLQVQKILYYEGAEGLRDYVEYWIDRFREINPDIIVSAQFWLPAPNTPEQTLEGINKISDIVNRIALFSPMNASAVSWVLARLGRSSDDS